MIKGDLHCHTRFSDGASTMGDLFGFCRKNGVDFLAVSDHDTFGGSEAALEWGDKGSVKALFAVEFSCFDYKRGNKVHILCYAPKEEKNLRAICKCMTDNRREAGEEMLKKIMALYPLSREDVERHESLTGCIYKQHIMHTLMEYGYTDRIYGELFQQLFHSKTGSCFVPLEYPDVRDVLREIRDSGGVSVMAHPGNYHGIDLMEELARERAVDGLELWHAKNSEADRQKIRLAAEKAGLLLTGGSDFHGMYNSNRCAVGAHITPQRELERLLDRTEN